MEAEEEIVPYVPCATTPLPPKGFRLLGVVVASSEWNVGPGTAAEDLQRKLSAKALKLYPDATAMYNFQWKPGAGYHGHDWYDGSADVYTGWAYP